jgi:hypothetical protein
MTLFGGILELQSGSGTAIFVGMLLILLFFELLLRVLEEVLTEYHGLLEKLVREFMIMGVISFISYFVIEANNFSENEYFLAFHFSHFIVFFIAIGFMMQAIFLVGVFSFRHKELLRYGAVTCAKLIEQYNEVSPALTEEQTWQTYLFHRGPIVLDFPRLRANIEYKIIEAYFIRVYSLPLNFNYSVYLFRTLKKYMIALVEVRPVNWLILAALVAINYARIEALASHRYYGRCDYAAFMYGHHGVGEDDHAVDDHALDDHYVEEAEHLKIQCEEYMISYVVFVVMFLFLYDLILLVTSEIYMRKLLALVIKAEKENYAVKTATQDPVTARGMVRRMSIRLMGGSAADKPNTPMTPGRTLADDILEEQLPRHSYLACLNQINFYERRFHEIRTHSDIIENKVTHKSLFDNDSEAKALARTNSRDNMKNNTAMNAQRRTGPVAKPNGVPDAPDDQQLPAVNLNKVPRKRSVGFAPDTADNANADSYNNGTSNASANPHTAGPPLPEVQHSTQRRGSLQSDHAADSNAPKPKEAPKRSGSFHDAFRRLRAFSLHSGEEAPRPDVVLDTPDGSRDHNNQGDEDEDEKDNDLPEGRDRRSSFVTEAEEFLRRGEQLAPVIASETHRRRSASVASVGSVGRGDDSDEAQGMSAGAAPGTDRKRPSLFQKMGTFYNRVNQTGDDERSPQAANQDSTATTNTSSVGGHAPLAKSASLKRSKSMMVSKRGSFGYRGRQSLHFFEEHEKVEEEVGTCQQIGLYAYEAGAYLLRFLVEHEGDKIFEDKEQQDVLLERTISDFNKIFLGSNPVSYYHAIEVALLCQCVYMALWATNFFKIAAYLPHAYKWQIAMILPMVVKTYILSKVVYYAGLLRTVCKLDTKIAEEVTDEANKHILVMEKFRSTCHIVLEALEFNDIDDEREKYKQKMILVHTLFQRVCNIGSDAGDGSPANSSHTSENGSHVYTKTMSFPVFCSFIAQVLRINLSNKTAYEVFCGLDKDGDGAIAWEDISIVIFPETAASSVQKNISSTKLDDVLSNKHMRRLSALTFDSKGKLTETEDAEQAEHLFQHQQLQLAKNRKASLMVEMQSQVTRRVSGLFHAGLHHGGEHHGHHHGHHGGHHGHHGHHTPHHGEHHTPHKGEHHGEHHTPHSHHSKHKEGSHEDHKDGQDAHTSNGHSSSHATVGAATETPVPAVAANSVELAASAHAVGESSNADDATNTGDNSKNSTASKEDGGEEEGSSSGSESGSSGSSTGSGSGSRCGSETGNEDGDDDIETGRKKKPSSSPTASGHKTMSGGSPSAVAGRKVGVPENRRQSFIPFQQAVVVQTTNNDDDEDGDIESRLSRHHHHRKSTQESYGLNKPTPSSARDAVNSPATPMTPDNAPIRKVPTPTNKKTPTGTATFSGSAGNRRGSHGSYHPVDSNDVNIEMNEAFKHSDAAAGEQHRKQVDFGGSSGSPKSDKYAKKPKGSVIIEVDEEADDEEAEELPEFHKLQEAHNKLTHADEPRIKKTSSNVSAQSSDGGTPMSSASGSAPTRKGSAAASLFENVEIDI